MDLPSNEILKDIEKRYNLEFSREPKALVRQIRKYRSIGRFQSDGREPFRLTEFYKFSKEIKRKWTIKDVHEAIKELQRVMKLTKEEAISKLIICFAQNYILLYEWVTSKKNNYEYGELNGIELTAIAKPMILR